MILKTPSSVNFDPSNYDHRIAVRAFMKRRAWADANIRFSHDPAYSNIVEQVQTKLLEWYMENHTLI